MSGLWDTVDSVVNWGGNAVDTITDIIDPSILSKGGRLEGLGKGLGHAGTALDVLGAGMGAYNAYDGFSRGDADAGWNGVGQTANGVIGAGLYAYPGAGAAFAAYSVGADTLGGLSGSIEADTAFSADSITGGLLRGAVGDESIGGSVADMMGGGIPGWIAGTAVNMNPYVMGANIADSAAGGIINWAGNMIDDDEVRNDYYGDAKDAAWNYVADSRVGRDVAAAGNRVSDDLGRAGRRVGNDLYNAGSRVANDAWNFVEPGVDYVADRAGEAADWVGDRANDAWDFVEPGVDYVTDRAGEAADWVGDRANDAWDFVEPGVDYVADRAGEAYDYASDRVNEGVDWVGDRASDAWDFVEPGVDYVADRAGEAYDWTADRAGEAYDWTSDRAGEAYDYASDRVNEGVDWVGDRA
ncbi:MAG: hypothetical protein ACKV2T_36755, partial [Kofleriaceae bacterium]